MNAKAADTPLHKNVQASKQPSYNFIG